MPPECNLEHDGILKYSVALTSLMLAVGAKHVHACEWNPAALEALHRNVHLNGVADRCTILPGDCRAHAPKVHLLTLTVSREVTNEGIQHLCEIEMTCSQRR